ncbi:MAG TPA: carboxylesterase/lipase family protein [Rhizomicrobium sp.]|jgi:para-nitrobenzyl esterase
MTIEIAQGKLQGYRDGDVLRFAGIPFAKAERWQMPQAGDAWSGTYDATQFRAVAIQDPKQIDILKGPVEPLSEECLFLNVWTPACDGGKRPVMVWIHGGGFVTGSGYIGAYEGTHLAARGDVVVVTINYRLGAFGFLNLRDATDGKLPGTGAEGIADQIAALNWVHDNIAAFGGDAANVTIFGESAGSGSVCALLAAPSAKGLFHKAICESGAAHLGTAREKSAVTAKTFLQKLGCADDPARALELSSEALFKAQREIETESAGRAGLPFGPTADGDVLPVRAIDAIRNGSAKDVSLIAGTTRDETKLMFAFSQQFREQSADALRKRMNEWVGEEHAGTTLAAYGAQSPYEIATAVITDNVFWYPTVKLLEAQSAFAPSYGYRIDWPSPMMGGIVGAGHVIEVGFVFGTYARPEVKDFFGTGPDADALSAAMMDSWLAFAKSGNPTTPKLDWPRYDANRRATMIFGDGAPHVENDPNAARRKAWDAIGDKRIGL